MRHSSLSTRTLLSLSLLLFCAEDVVAGFVGGFPADVDAIEEVELKAVCIFV
jgi:hypothetical protein